MYNASLINANLFHEQKNTILVSMTIYLVEGRRSVHLHVYPKIDSHKHNRSQHINISLYIYVVGISEHTDTHFSLYRYITFRAYQLCLFMVGEQYLRGSAQSTVYEYEYRLLTASFNPLGATFPHPVPSSAWGALWVLTKARRKSGGEHTEKPSQAENSRGVTTSIAAARGYIYSHSAGLSHVQPLHRVTTSIAAARVYNI